MRPLPKLSQTTPKVCRSQKQQNRIGRTRMLTDTAETNAIALDHQRQLKKLKKVSRRLQPSKLTHETVKYKTRVKNNNISDDSLEEVTRRHFKPKTKNQKILPIKE